MKRRCRIDPDSAFLRRSVAALTRLRNGWRPNKSMLADARYAEHWLVIRRDDTTGYQFIGFPPRSPERSSMFIATVLAIDPAAGWALLAGGEWIRTGDALPMQSPFDAADVAKCAESWLAGQTQCDDRTFRYPR